MELSELTAYAEEKFNIHEQHKWADFPGFSVLADPNTGKWVALLMRQWDYETGTEIQRCDIKCGAQTLAETPRPYLSAPYRMKGPKWVGVRFGEGTDNNTVCRLFDRAVYSGEQRGYTIVLGSLQERGAAAPVNEAIPDFRTVQVQEDERVPEKIREMLRLYEYRGTSLSAKAENFFRQGRFMADYEDDAPWTGQFLRYFPTYHDLNIPQLRGYFTWRTHVRHGEFTPISTSLAYLYVYELLNGIGASSPEDSLEKLLAFKTGFLDSGVGSKGMYGNLNRWMLEFAVIKGLPTDTARKYANQELLRRDSALAALRTPEKFSDEEVFSALNLFPEKKPELSPVVQKFPEKGRKLFASVWRCASERYSEDGESIFAACFGEIQVYPWRPLGNALYYSEHVHPDADYELDECRSYHCRGGVWQEERYDSLNFHLDLLNGLLHETDRVLRKSLKTGHYLRAKQDETWATQYAEAALEAVRRAELEAAKPKIKLDLASLERIRRDASATRDSLLTAEELDEQDTGSPPPPEPEEKPAPESGALAALDSMQRRILLALARGEVVDGYIKEARLMPSVVADAINEALFDEIGDNVVECDGDSLAVVDDYREDVLRMFGGKSE